MNLGGVRPSVASMCLLRRGSHRDSRLESSAMARLILALASRHTQGDRNGASFLCMEGVRGRYHDSCD